MLIHASGKSTFKWGMNGNEYANKSLLVKWAQYAACMLEQERKKRVTKFFFLPIRHPDGGCSKQFTSSTLDVPDVMPSIWTLVLA